MPVRTSTAAGRFYPAEPHQLRYVTEACLEEAQASPAPDTTFAVIAPHAGYRYSGKCAAEAFAQVRGKQPRRVVLLGRSHHHQFEGASVYQAGAFETPLGTLPIDREFAYTFARAFGDVEEYPHEEEHALEVELPFIQIVLGEVPIVPVLFGTDPQPWHLDAGRVLEQMMEPEDLLVISTDFSHYLDEVNAKILDQQTIDTVLACDTESLLTQPAPEGTCALCAAPAVIAGIECGVARGAQTARLLDYRTSALVSGETASVVGYASVALETPPPV